jgi:hypothetical protein
MEWIVAAVLMLAATERNNVCITLEQGERPLVPDNGVKQQ